MTESTDPRLARFLAGQPLECDCGRSHRIRTGRVSVGRGQIDLIADLLPREIGKRATIALLADVDTEAAAARRVVDRLRAAGYSGLRELVLPAQPHGDDLTLDTIDRQLATTVDLMVAVGSGTISDLGKAFAAARQIPLVTCGTAASMNGYTSPIVALTVKGLKRTLPTIPPHTLVLDTDVLAAAPARLTRAGFGDLVSKPVSGADWCLSAWFGIDPVCHAALSIADEAVVAARAVAAAIGRCEPAAVETLGVALVVSGFAMDVAGASSPASGGEHLISHYIDVSAAAWKHEPFLHGEQVAVGTLVSVDLYERLRHLMPIASDPPPDDELEPHLRTLHAHLSTEALAALLQQALAKATRAPGRAARRAQLAARWRELWTTLDAQLAGGAALRDDLELAGVPTRFAQIGIDEPRARHVVRYARHMRDRYTVLDLAADLGLAADEVIRW